MKIIMVFSSPSSATSEYRNLWCCCPQKREIDTGQLVIEGNGWRVLVYDGLNKKYWDLEWNISMFECEVMAIKKQYEDSSMAILLHGYETEINILKQRLTSSLNSKIMDVCYSSEKGTFYEEDLKSFSNNASDQNFEILWKVIEEIQSEKALPVSIVEAVRSLKHNSFNIAGSMMAKIVSAKKDIRNLSEFEKFVRHIKLLEKDHQAIAQSECYIKNSYNERVKTLLAEILQEIQTMGRDGTNSKAAFCSAQDCLKKTEEIHSIFEKMWEDING